MYGGGYGTGYTQYGQYGQQQYGQQQYITNLTTIPNPTYVQPYAQPYVQSYTHQAYTQPFGAGKGYDFGQNTNNINKDISMAK
jgi:hypothetical protein